MKCAFYILYKALINKALEKEKGALMANFVICRYSWAIYYLFLHILYILRREPDKNQFFHFSILKK